MRIGLALPQFGPLADAARIAPFAAAVEELGFDTVGVGDRLLTPLAPRDPYPGRQQPYPAEFTTGLDPIVTLSVAAAATTRIGLTTSTLNVPQFNPVLLGRALTSLDVLSGGRLTVGVGLGWMRDEYEAAGVDWCTRGARLDETLDLWQALWTTNPVRHEGTFHRLVPSVVDLRPVRPGGPELLFAGLRPAAMRRVGERGAGWLAVQGLPEAYARSLWDAARKAADDAGRDPDRLRRVLRVNVPPGVDPVAHVAAAAVDPYDEVLVDLTFCARDVDEALEVAARIRRTA
ncbi:MAG: TIGR03619 family F420-dependent LLM class oxidoreductase [Actinoplanes sp.]